MYKNGIFDDITVFSRNRTSLTDITFMTHTHTHTHTQCHTHTHTDRRFSIDDINLSFQLTSFLPKVYIEHANILTHTYTHMPCTHTHTHTHTYTLTTQIQMWETATLQSMKILEGHKEAVTTLQYDSKVLITGSYDHTVR